MAKRDKILLDANVFIAVVHLQDPHHKRAIQMLEEMKEKKPLFITNNHIVDEALTVTVLRAKSIEYATILGESVFGNVSPWLKIYRVPFSWEQEAFEIFRKQKTYTKDRFLSFTDCILLAQARQQNISMIFSFDQELKRFENEWMTIIS